jgi:hypothetical protein
MRLDGVECNGRSWRWRLMKNVGVPFTPLRIPPEEIVAHFGCVLAARQRFS